MRESPARDGPLQVLIQPVEPAPVHLGGAHRIARKVTVHRSDALRGASWVYLQCLGGALPECMPQGLVALVPTPCTCIRRFAAARSRGADRLARAALRVRRLARRRGWLEPS
jgi:hypothetical protein